ncbi:regulator of nucleoside diphosphate kinase [Pedobacter sp. UYEF25]
MNLPETNPVMITQEDYNLLKPYFSKLKTISNEMSLSSELSRAIILKKEVFPAHAIRLNSKISIKDESSGKITELTIVLPEFANIKEKKISVLTPIAAALIGFRKGETVRWKVPAGVKTFKITEVEAPK